MTPIKIYSKDLLISESEKDLTKEQATAQIEELWNYNFDPTKIQCTTIKGEQENMNASVVVPHTGHELTDAYIETIKAEIDRM